MKKIFAGVICILIFLNIVHAELIDGPANLREKPNGKVLISLNNNVHIGCCGLPENGWYTIIFETFIKEDSFVKDITQEKFTFDGEGNTYVPEIRLKKGAILYNSNKEEIGVVVSEGIISGWYYPPKDDKENHLLACDLIAYTFQNNIQPNSNVENQLVKDISEKDKPIKISNFQEHIKKNGYFEWVRENDFESYRKDEVSEGLFPRGMRVGIVFYKGNLVAVIFTERPVNFKFTEMTKGKGTFKIGYIMKLEHTVKKELEDLFFKASQAY